MASKNLDSGESPNLLEEAHLLEKETRFAVVMYGGVSLAIYINGVAQELYSMVRATAQDGMGISLSMTLKD